MGPATWRLADGEVATFRLGALPEVREPAEPRGVTGTDAVVGDLDTDPPESGSQGDVDPRRLGVTDGVGQCLRDDRGDVIRQLAGGHQVDGSIERDAWFGLELSS